MKYPNLIQELARLEGLRQIDLRKKTGYSHSHFNSIWNGKKRPSIEGMEKIAKILQKPVYKVFCL